MYSVTYKEHDGWSVSFSQGYSRSTTTGLATSKVDRKCDVKAKLLIGLRIHGFGKIQDLAAKRLNKFGRIMMKRSLSRFILDKREYDSVSSDICNELDVHFAKHKYLRELLLLTHKCANQTTSCNFTNYINFAYKSTQSTRNNSFYACSMNVNNTWGTCSLKYSAVSEWLKINNAVKNSVGKQSKFKL